MNQAKKAVLMMLLTAFFWSLAGVFIKLVDLDALAIVCLRSLVASAAMWLLIRRQKFRWSWAMVGGALSYTAFTYCIVFSTKLTTSANAVMMQYTAPIYVAFLSWIVLKERVRKSDWICLAVVLGGMCLFFLDKMGGGSALGNVIALGNGISFALISIFLRFQKDGHPEQSILLGGFLAFLIGLPATVRSLGVQPPAPRDILVVIVAGITVTLGYRLFAAASKHLSALQTVMLPIIDPILNPVWVFLAVGERPGAISLCGGVIVLSAITVRALLLIRAPRAEGTDNMEQKVGESL